MKQTIFLSASVPDPVKDSIYYETADVTAIREAVRALAIYILPKAVLVWGGHPAITPMIRIVADNLGVNVQESVVMYQTRFFESSFIDDNKAFENIKFTPKYETENESLKVMRKQMLSDYKYRAGIFIGGMKGVEEEFKLFRRLHPNTPMFPVSSTGGAAQIIYNEHINNLPRGLNDDYSYFSLFRRLLNLDNLS